jgi:predicted HD phosphohydrolase
VKVASSVEELLAALRALDGFSDSLIGDSPIDLLSHSLQCANALAEAEADDELVVSGLFHDVGHGVAPGQQAAHGLTGAAFVRPVLGERVGRLIELHVPAKGYLVATDSSYAAALSPGSAASLRLQGGVMRGPALRSFEAAPLSGDAVLLRRADEAAKREDAQTPGVDAWEDLVQRVAARSLTSK